MKQPWTETKEALFTTYQTDAHGLSGGEAHKRLAQYGENKLIEGKQKSVLRVFAEQFADLLVVILLIAAIISALTGRKVRNDVAMTGEITIRGRVLPIGGLQEKVLAAKKVGIKTVILPKENKKDLDEIMDEIKDGMQFVLAETMEDVLQTALVKGEKDA